MARVFEMTAPAEPGPEVTQVQDKDGDVWSRKDGGWIADGIVCPWREVVENYAPLTDVTPEPEKPRTWDIPAEPGPEVKGVRDVDGEIWYRVGGRWSLDPGHVCPWRESWAFVMRHAPLTDATAEVGQ